jgi:hypothetical protein
MPITTPTGRQIRDNSIQRDDLDFSTVGQAVVRKIVQGTNINLNSTGADSGTGDVTINAIVPSVDATLICSGPPNSEAVFGDDYDFVVVG